MFRQHSLHLVVCWDQGLVGWNQQGGKCPFIAMIAYSSSQQGKVFGVCFSTKRSSLADSNSGSLCLIFEGPYSFLWSDAESRVWCSGLSKERVTTCNLSCKHSLTPCFTPNNWKFAVSHCTTHCAAYSLRCTRYGTSKVRFCTLCANTTHRMHTCPRM